MTFVSPCGMDQKHRQDFYNSASSMYRHYKTCSGVDQKHRQDLITVHLLCIYMYMYMHNCRTALYNQWVEHFYLGFNPVQGCSMFCFCCCAFSLLRSESPSPLQGYQYIRIDGRTPVESRQLLCDRFQHDDSCLVAVLSITTANAGEYMCIYTVVCYTVYMYM